MEDIVKEIKYKDFENDSDFSSTMMTPNNLIRKNLRKVKMLKTALPT
jgi:hypothetical protein